MAGKTLQIEPPTIQRLVFTFRIIHVSLPTPFSFYDLPFGASSLNPFPNLEKGKKRNATSKFKSVTYALLS